MILSTVAVPGGGTSIYFQLLFGSTSLNGTELLINTLVATSPEGTGTATLEDKGATIKWSVEGTTADGVGVQATIECGPVDRN